MITICIATSGRPQSLTSTLESLTKIDQPQSNWKILVAVNGGDRKSFDVAKTFDNRLPLKVFLISGSGKNRALNQILPQASEGWLLFTDDDIEFAPTWLTEWNKKLAFSPSHFIFSGRISLKAEPAVHQNLLSSKLPFDFLYSQTPLRPDGPLNAELCWGGNMAVHSNAFQKNLFNENIGPNGTRTYPMGSEVEFCLRLQRLGYKIESYSAPQVFHRIHPEQLTERWIWGRYFRAGRSAYLCRRRDAKEGKARPLIPFDLLKGLFFSYLKRIVNKEVNLRFQQAFLQGQIYEFLFATKLQQRPK